MTTDEEFVTAFRDTVVMMAQLARQMRGEQVTEQLALKGLVGAARQVLDQMPEDMLCFCEDCLAGRRIEIELDTCGAKVSRRLDS